MPWQPSDEGGVVLQLDAGTLTFTDGHNFTTSEVWPDQSGAGHDASCSTVGFTYHSSGGYSGSPYVACTGGQLTLPNAFSGLTAATIVISLASSTNTSENKALWKLGTDSDSAGTYYPFSDGNIYDGFGSNARYNYAKTVDVTAWHAFAITTTAGAGGYKAYMDNTLIFTSGTNTVAFRTTPVLFNYASTGWSGSAYRVAWFDHVLGSTALGNANTWALTASTPTVPPLDPNRSALHVRRRSVAVTRAAVR